MKQKLFKITCYRILMPILFLILTTAASGKNSLLFSQAISAYDQGEYENSIVHFERLVENGLNNGKLYYNLGNAHLKNLSPDKALLWYEKAAKAGYYHSYLITSYNKATSYINNTIKPPILLKTTPDVSFFMRATRPWIYFASILINLIFWGIFILKRTHLLKTGKPVLIILSGCSTLTIVVSLLTYYDSEYIKRGIILPDAAIVRSGCSENATELFTLHAGQKIKILEIKQTYFKIQNNQKKTGWIEKNTIGVI